MNSASAPSLVALTIQFGLGFAVFFANPKRRSNQCFLFLSLAICGWLTALVVGLASQKPAVTTFCMREASAAAAIIFAGFNLLRLSIRERQKDWQEIFHQSRVWLLVTSAIVVLCQTKLFLQGARIPDHATAGISSLSPIYGRLFASMWYTMSQRWSRFSIRPFATFEQLPVGIARNSSSFSSQES